MLWEVLNGLIVLAVGVLCVPAAVFFFQTISAALTRRPRVPLDMSAPAEPLASLAVLIPAHNEEGGLPATLIALRQQLAEGDRVVVVADNCSDGTAEVARSFGVEVVVRHDAERRGKGYALDRGVQYLAQRSPDIVVVIDADCIVEPQALQRLRVACQRARRPVQALYIMHSQEGAGLKARVGELAWTVKNHVRPLGFHVWGLPCQLMGTGMAFPWYLLHDAPLASGNIVEDMQLGIDLARTGTPPLFCPEAVVSSTFPLNIEGQQAQRTRWEHGHIAVMMAHGPRLLWDGLRRAQGKVLAMALDLCVPPLASLVIVLGVAGAVSLLWWAVSGYGGAAALALAALAMVTGGVLLAWARFARHVVSGRELAAIPLYVLGKLPLYGRLFTKRQTDWVRTKRDDGSR